MPDHPASGETATVDQDTLETFGRRIFEAERTRQPIAPLTDQHPALSMADAYAIQQCYARLRMERGAKRVGHKIGATSKAIQELFGIDTPDYGHLFEDMLCTESEPIPIGSLIQPKAEPEIAFVLAETLTGPGLTPADVLAASRGVVPCLEIIDSRIEDWRIRLADTIADNGSSGRFVVGSRVIPLDGLDLTAEAVVFYRNGEVVGRGEGRAVLGHPATSAAWLANALGEFGQPLEAGWYVLSGSITTAVPALPGDRIRAEFTHIGSVSCLFDGEEGSGG